MLSRIRRQPLATQFSRARGWLILAQSFAGSRKRKHSSDDDAKCTFVDQLTQLDELRAVRLNDEECSSKAERSRFLGRNRTHNADKNAAAAATASAKDHNFLNELAASK